MGAVIVMVPHLNGGWSYYRSFKPMDLTQDQMTYIKVLGATIEQSDGALWIRSKDPRMISEYLDRLQEDMEREDR